MEMVLMVEKAQMVEGDRKASSPVRILGLALSLSLLVIGTLSAQRIERRGQRPGAERPLLSVADTVTSWAVWWKLNKDRYQTAVPEAGTAVTGSGDCFLGRRASRPASPPPSGIASDAWVRALVAAAKDDHVEVRERAAYAAGLAGPRAPESVARVLSEALRDAHHRVRTMAILGLGIAGHDGAVSTLREILRKSAAGTEILGDRTATDRQRAVAALALGLLGDVQALDVLRQAATQTGENREVQACAVIGLGLLHDAGACETLARMAGGSRISSEIRALAVTALGQSGCRETLPALGEALQDRRATVRRAAVLAVGVAVPSLTPRRGEGTGEVEDEGVGWFRAEARRWLAEMAEEGVFPVRTVAAVTLGQIGNADDLDLLVELLFDASREVGNFAALGIGLLAREGYDADGHGRLSLVHAFKRSAAADRTAALAIALGLSGDAAFAPVLADGLDRGGHRLRSYVAEALGMLGHVAAAPEVAQLLLQVRDAEHLERVAPAVSRLCGVPGAPPAVAEELRRLVASTGDRFVLRNAGVALALGGRPEDCDRAAATVARSDALAADRALLIEALGLASRRPALNPLGFLAAGLAYHVAFGAIDDAVALKW